MNQSKTSCLARYQKGDVNALSDLVEQYRKPLYAFILRMTEGGDDAEEIFQEVWFRAIKKLHKFKAENMLSWLFRIAHNLIIDRGRTRKKYVHLQGDDVDHEGTLEDCLASKNLGPAEESAANDLGLRISDAVGKLSIEQREVFLMRMEGDLSFKEIAAIQKITLNTALARMRYAVLKLRDELGAEYQAIGEH